MVLGLQADMHAQLCLCGVWIWIHGECSHTERSPQSLFHTFSASELLEVSLFYTDRTLREARRSALNTGPWSLHCPLCLAVVAGHLGRWKPQQVAFPCRSWGLLDCPLKLCGPQGLQVSSLAIKLLPALSPLPHPCAFFLPELSDC